MEIILFKTTSTYGAADLDGNILVSYVVKTCCVCLEHKQMFSLTKGRVENTKFVMQE